MYNAAFNQLLTNSPFEQLSLLPIDDFRENVYNRPHRLQLTEIKNITHHHLIINTT